MGTFTDDRRAGIVGTEAPPCERPMQFSTVSQIDYFAGRQVKVEGRYGVGGYVEWPQPDRLSSNARHHPYGEERGTSSTEYKFATYQREASGLDYALNRYYSSVYGRFLSSDPYRASGGPSDPGSWNRYAYVQGDPVNFNDPTGLYLSRSSDERRENSNVGAKDLSGWYSGAYGGSSSPAGSSSGRDGAGGRSRRPDFAGWESALAALDTHECATALGFENSETAKMRLHGTGIVRREGPTAVFEQNVLSGWWQLNTILPAWVDNDTIYLNTNLFLEPDQIKNPEGKSLLNYAQITLGLSDVPTVATFQAIYLLHELGHISGHLPNDRNDVKTSETNSRTVVENCFPGLRLQ